MADLSSFKNGEENKITEVRHGAESGPQRKADAPSGQKESGHLDLLMRELGERYYALHSRDAEAGLAPIVARIRKIREGAAAEQKQLVHPAPAAALVPPVILLRPKFCTHCGHELIEGAKFCVVCGSPVPPVIPEVVPARPVQAAGPEKKADTRSEIPEGEIRKSAGEKPCKSSDEAAAPQEIKVQIYGVRPPEGLTPYDEE